MKHVVAFAIVLLLPACSSLDANDGNLTAVSRGNDVILRNGTPERVYFFLVGRKAGARIEWVQTLNRANSVAAGSERRIPYDEIMLAEGGELEAHLHWWHAQRIDGEAEPGKRNFMVVDLN